MVRLSGFIYDVQIYRRATVSEEKTIGSSCLQDPLYQVRDIRSLVPKNKLLYDVTGRQMKTARSRIRLSWSENE